MDKASVRVDDRPSSSDKLEGLVEGHVMVLHEVGNAQRGTAALAGTAVHQDLPSRQMNLVDLGWRYLTLFDLG